MSKIRAFLVALALIFTSVGVSQMANVLPVSAWTASCVFAPSYPQGSTYGGAFCSTNRIGGAFHRVVITCKYVQYGINHTYNHYGAWAPDNQWSWANCSTHWHDQYVQQGADWVIHAWAEFDPNDQYSGGGSSGSW